MDTNIYYCLPQAGGRIRSQGNYCLPPEGGRIRSQGNKKRLRRNHEWAEVWIGWLSRFKLIRLRRISLATLRWMGGGIAKRYVQ